MKAYKGVLFQLYPCFEAYARSHLWKTYFLINVIPRNLHSSHREEWYRNWSRDDCGNHLCPRALHVEHAFIYPFIHSFNHYILSTGSFRKTSYSQDPVTTVCYQARAIKLVGGMKVSNQLTRMYADGPGLSGWPDISIGVSHIQNMEAEGQSQENLKML